MALVRDPQVANRRPRNAGSGEDHRRRLVECCELRSIVDGRGSVGLRDLAKDWRQLLYPKRER